MVEDDVVQLAVDVCHLSTRPVTDRRDQHSGDEGVEDRLLESLRPIPLVGRPEVVEPEYVEPVHTPHRIAECGMLSSVRHNYTPWYVLAAEKIVKDEYERIQSGDTKYYVCDLYPCKLEAFPNAHAFHMHNVVVHGMNPGLPKGKRLPW